MINSELKRYLFDLSLSGNNIEFILDNYMEEKTRARFFGKDSNWPSFELVQPNAVKKAYVDKESFKFYPATDKHLNFIFIDLVVELDLEKINPKLPIVAEYGRYFGHNYRIRAITKQILDKEYNECGIPEEYKNYTMAEIEFVGQVFLEKLKHIDIPNVEQDYVIIFRDDVNEGKMRSDILDDFTDMIFLTSQANVLRIPVVIS